MSPEVTLWVPAAADEVAVEAAVVDEELDVEVVAPGIDSFCPVRMIADFPKPFAEMIAETEVLYLRASPHTVSPDFTVCVPVDALLLAEVDEEVLFAVAVVVPVVGITMVVPK